MQNQKSNACKSTHEANQHAIHDTHQFQHQFIKTLIFAFCSLEILGPFKRALVEIVVQCG